MRTQLLFGEAYEVLKHSGKWVQIRLLWDDYTAWISAEQHCMRCETTAAKNQSLPMARDVLTELRSVKDHSLLYIPRGSRLNFVDENKLQMHDDTWLFNGRTAEPATRASGGELLAASMNYLHAPYLWGGRSPFGMDCSGLIQMAAAFCGLRMPRDAYEQAECGKIVDGIAVSKHGDVAFFHNNEGKITHTGIITGNGRIVHASGKVRLDKLDEQGIFNEEKNCHTHQLAHIRRIT